MKNEMLENLKGKIIVSCQGNKEDGNPVYSPKDLLLMAKSAYAGGARAFRANKPENVKAIKEYYPSIPMFGIWKVVSPNSKVYITPTMKEIEVLRDLGCEVIAMDGTNRLNCDGRPAYELIREAKKKYPDQLIMADIANLEDATLSYEAGADILSTTLSGYTENTKDRYALGCDIEVIKQIREKYPDVYINAEGRVWELNDAKNAFEAGADFVCVGTAITNPMKITSRFVEYFKKINK